jgi:WD40 repeat protein
MLWHNAQLDAAYRTSEGRRTEANSNLYHSRVGEARALRKAREDGYRPKVFDLLKQALQLETPDKDLLVLREEAAACLGDFVGLEPTTWDDLPTGTRIWSVALHPAGTQLAMGLFDGTVLLRPIPAGEPIVRLTGHRSAVAAVGYRANGKELVSVDWTGTIKLWQAHDTGAWTCRKTSVLESGLTLLTPSLAFPFFTPILTSWISTSPCMEHPSAALTADGRYVAVPSWLNSVINLVDVADGRTAARFPVPQGELVWTVAVSPDGKLLAGGYEHHGTYGVLLWDIRTRALLKRLEPQKDEIRFLRFAPNGKLLVSSHSGGIALYEISTFQLRPFERAELPTAIAFSPDSQLLAYQAWNLRQVRLWDIAKNWRVATLSCPGAFWAEFSQDGKILVAVTPHRYRASLVRIWNLAGASERLILEGHSHSISDLVFRPDGKFLASGSADRTIKIWDPIGGTLVKELTEFSSAPLCFSPDGRILAAGESKESTIRFYDGESWKELTVIDSKVGPPVLSIAFSADGQYFAAAGSHGITLWRVVRGIGEQPDGRMLSLQPFPQLTEEFSASICFSPDGHWLAWAAGHWHFDIFKINVWDMRSSQPYALSIAKSLNLTKALAFYPDSKHLAFVSDKSAIAVWDVITKQELPSFGEGQLQRRSIFEPTTALSADGAWYAVADQTVTIWDMAAQKLLVALLSERSPVQSVAWSPNRELLAVATSDGGLEIWNLPTVNARLAEIGLGW